MTRNTVGILALQGDYAAHAQMLTRLEQPWRLVRTSSELAAVQGLIIPGGESTTLLRFLQNTDLASAIQAFAAQQKPIFGTCAGAILLAKKVHSPTQISLNLIDVEIQRNAYGRQLASQVTVGELQSDRTPMEMVFIRAPQITALGKDVKILATYQAHPVAVEANANMIATFHPELGHDLRLHTHFLEKLKQSA